MKRVAVVGSVLSLTALLGACGPTTAGHPVSSSASTEKVAAPVEEDAAPGVVGNYAVIWRASADGMGRTEAAVVDVCGKNCITYKAIWEEEPGKPETERSWTYRYRFTGARWETDEETDPKGAICPDGHPVSVKSYWVINKDFTQGHSVDSPTDCGDGPKAPDAAVFDLKRK